MHFCDYLCTPEIGVLREKLCNEVWPGNKDCRESDEYDVDHLEGAKVANDRSKNIMRFFNFFRWFFNLQITTFFTFKNML